VAWRLISAEVDQLRAPVRVRAAAEIGVVQLLRWVFDTRVRVGPARPDGRVDVEVSGPHVAALAGMLAGFGARLEVFEPTELRSELVRVGEELRTLYSARPGLEL
jgi:hypothetical protein